MYHVSIVSINNYIKRFDETGSVLSEFELNNKSGKKMKPKKILVTDEYEDTIMELCDTDPTQSMAKYVETLYGQHGIYIDYNTINRSFERNNITYKKIARIAMIVLI